MCSEDYLNGLTEASVTAALVPSDTFLRVSVCKGVNCYRQIMRYIRKELWVCKNLMLFNGDEKWGKKQNENPEPCYDEMWAS